jgi:hypothetical protein
MRLSVHGMSRSVRKELRLTAEMVERIDEARGDVSFNRFVERALESALGGKGVEQAGAPDVPQGRPLPVPAPSRAPAKKTSIAATWRR